MLEKRDEWVFFRLRAAQLFEEGNARAALRLLERINLRQVEWLDEAEEECEQTENC